MTVMISTRGTQCYFFSHVLFFFFLDTLFSLLVELINKFQEKGGKVKAVRSEASFSTLIKDITKCVGN